MDMSSTQIVYTLVDVLGVFSTLVVLAAAGYAAFQLNKAKQPAIGGWLLLLARLVVLFVSFGFLILNLVGSNFGLSGLSAGSLFLRLLMLLAYLATIAALVMFRPWKEDAHG